ncbi:MAG: hypothetical protein RR404_01080 [Bacilli bacterium]
MIDYDILLQKVIERDVVLDDYSVKQANTLAKALKIIFEREGYTIDYSNFSIDLASKKNSYESNSMLSKKEYIINVLNRSGNQEKFPFSYQTASADHECGQMGELKIADGETIIKIEFGLNNLRENPSMDFWDMVIDTNMKDGGKVTTKSSGVGFSTIFYSAEEIELIKNGFRETVKPEENVMVYPYFAEQRPECEVLPVDAREKSLEALYNTLLDSHEKMVEKHQCKRL